jgi:hypothetical protein
VGKKNRGKYSSKGTATRTIMNNIPVRSSGKDGHLSACFYRGPLFFLLFLVGLTINSELGLRILGFGAAGICVVLGMPYALSRCFGVRVIMNFEDWEEWKHREREIRRQHWSRHGVLKTVAYKIWPFELLYPDFDMTKKRLILWVGWSAPEE